MIKYQNQTRLLAAVDCIIFGFDGTTLKLLLVQRAIQPEKGRWSLMGGFVQPEEALDAAAVRTLNKLTGLDGVYMEQLGAFGTPHRDPMERTLSVAYFALIDMNHISMIKDQFRQISQRKPFCFILVCQLLLIKVNVYQRKVSYG